MQCTVSFIPSEGASCHESKFHTPGMDQEWMDE
jgi:hypothetical protein